MYYPTIDLSSNYSRNFFNIVQVGAGGNGGYLVQRLSKLLYALSEKDKNLEFSYKIIDGDIVESKNLQRQPFISQDLDQPKAKVLAERYSNAYQIPIFYKDEYINSPDNLHELFNIEYSFGSPIQILIGCVDNNASRQIMHKYFESSNTIIYLDSGIDSVDPEASKESGYSGQVVCGYRRSSKTILAPVGGVYENILTDKDSRLPMEACGQQVVNYPQRMQTNEMAALIMNGYLNTILADHEIVSHYTNFNARNNIVSPTYLTKDMVS